MFIEAAIPRHARPDIEPFNRGPTAALAHRRVAKRRFHRGQGVFAARRIERGQHHADPVGGNARAGVADAVVDDDRNATREEFGKLRGRRPALRTARDG